MPLGLVVYHDAGKKWGSEAVAQGNGPALGRELEIADILRFIKHNEIRNVAWITADVHYCATHLYEPGRAQFTDFAPFYEFVSGPLHAGGFGPNELDDTFGPRVVFTKNPEGRANPRRPRVATLRSRQDRRQERRDDRQPSGRRRAASSTRSTWRRRRS